MSRKRKVHQDRSVKPSSPERELDRWEQFWFSPQTYERLIFQRIGLGVVVLLVVASFWGNIDRWFGGTGLMSTNRLARIVTSTEVIEAARWRLSIINYLESPLALHSFLAVVGACGVLMTLGLGGRVAVLGCWIGMLSIANSSWVVADSGWIVFCLSLLTMLIAGAGNRSLWKPTIASDALITSWHGIAIRLTQIHLIGFLLTYGFNSLITAWPARNTWQILLAITILMNLIGIVFSPKFRTPLVGLLVVLLAIIGIYSGDFILSISLMLMSTVYLQPWSRASTTN